jgi:hypothetical protein
VAADDVRARHYDVDVRLLTAKEEPDLREALNVLSCRTRSSRNLRKG